MLIQYAYIRATRSLWEAFFRKYNFILRCYASLTFCSEHPTSQSTSGTSASSSPPSLSSLGSWARINMGNACEFLDKILHQLRYIVYLMMYTWLYMYINSAIHLRWCRNFLYLHCKTAKPSGSSTHIAHQHLLPASANMQSLFLCYITIDI